MHWSLVVLSLVLLGFAAISGRIEGTPVTPAMVFTVIGLAVGAKAIGLDEPAPYGHEIKLLAEATLSVVLFSEASRIDRGQLLGQLSLPARLLGIGLPLTILAGFVVAHGLLGVLAWPEALLLGVILAPTDAALGQAVVSLPRLPLRVRQSLNVESGLNDGICVPLFLVVLAVAQAEEAEVGWGRALRLLVEKIGYGALGGVVAGMLAAGVVLFSERTGFAKSVWLQVVPVAGAALAFGLAEAIGGSGFIAAYVGGAVFGRLPKRAEEAVSYLIDELAAVLAAVTFVVFGAVLLRPALDDVTWQIGLYAVCSLTIVRLVPVAIALIGTRARLPTVALFGWFGPRGLASIIFALILVEEGGLPHDGVILTVTFATVGLSVLAHGVSAAPLANRYADWSEASPRAELGL
jgi:sodium/hydrogen antiporter